MEKKLILFGLLTGLISISGDAQAALVQRLTAVNSASVVTNSSRVVSQWTDQSGSGNNAVSNGGAGSVYYPSTSLSASGKAGLDFGATRNSLVAMNATTASNVLNSANGFAVLIAFKSDGQCGDLNDVIGVTSTTTDGGFGLRYGKDPGALSLYFGGKTIGKTGCNVATNDTIVFGVNYNDTTLAYELWDSKTGNSLNGTLTAAQATNDFSKGTSLRLGTTTLAGRFLNGMIGEVRIYDAALSSNEFSAAQTEMVNTWIGYRLTVNSGSGSGTYGDGQSVPITASNLTGKAFVAWTGDTQYLAGAVSSASNTVIMPTNAVTLTATYVDTIYTLTVNNGSGSGTYNAGTQVPIEANPVNPPNSFISWIGDTQYLSGAASSASNTVIMPSKTITLTATYLMAQHLTAEVSGSVLTNSSGVVSQWTDQSGSGNHAVSNGGVGSVYYPGASLSASRKAGLDFGTNRNTLVALNAATASNVLNSANGFSVMIAFKSDGPCGDFNDVFGNSHLTSAGFSLRYGPDGAISAFLGGKSIVKGGRSVEAGDTIIFGFNYNDTTRAYEFWDSKNDNSATGTLDEVQAAMDFSNGKALTLGGTPSSTGRFLNGMIAEVRIYNTALNAGDFQVQCEALATNWEVNPLQHLFAYPLFQHNMVLQRDMGVPVWGQALTGAVVTLKLDGTTVGTAVTGPDGKWVARIGSHSHDGGVPHALEISAPDESSVTLTNIVFGDVYLASGQSNMELLLNDNNVIGGAAEIAAANYPLVRQVSIANVSSTVPLTEPSFNWGWTLCSPATASRFSATGYFFAKNAHLQTGVPVGLLFSAWGAKEIKRFIAPEGVAAIPELAGLHQFLEGGGDAEYYDIYNGMIAPLIPYGMRGAIWYQGEWDSGRGDHYHQHLRALMAGWRQNWGQGDFPFYYVQLPNYGSGFGAATIREAELRALSETNCGMAVTIDTGDGNLHPKNKQDVGGRLALWAVARDAGQNIPYRSPLLSGVTNEGGCMRIYFDYADVGLMVGSKDSTNPVVVSAGPLENFEVAGSDKVFVAASAAIDGCTVVVSNASVAQPVYVRYCYTNLPAGTNKLYNLDGLPASPFRTDEDYPLTVQSGSGDTNALVPGAVQSITADAAPAGMVFDRWIGTASDVDNLNASSTVVAMPQHALYLLAAYRSTNSPVYMLTVNQGYGTGTSQAGSYLNIEAQAPASGWIFDHWAGDTQTVDNVLSSSTTLKMPDSSVTVTPVYKSLVTAGFTAVPTNGIVPLPVTFTDQSEGSITNLLWDFGDGQTTNTAGGAQVEHVYQAAGSYTVTLIASGPDGMSTNTQISCITVNLPLIQHLDAAVAASVSTNESGQVINWADQSGNGNNATTAVGSVKFPSASLAASGLAGLDFGTNRNSLQLFSSTGSDRWLDQSAGTNGFCVLVAFKCDGLINDWNDLIGNSSTLNSGFWMRYGSGGIMQANLGPSTLQKSGTAISAGDTVVYGFNYSAAAGACEFWDSKNYSSLSDTVSPADFSLSAPVTLGSTVSSGRYMNGMVGEVKVYDRVLSAGEFKTQCEALAEKWADIPLSAPVQWRVIAEDPDYPEDESVVAGIVIGDPGFSNPLPADPAAEDCTATFQEALQSMAAAGGGTVFVPPGHYRFDGSLSIPAGVTLRGRWKQPGADQPVTGTVLDVYTGRGVESTDATAAFLVCARAGSGVRNLTFWYPEQEASSIVPYPFTVGAVSIFTTIENITLVNSYLGLNMNQSSMLCLRGVFGTALKLGLLADQGYAVPRFDSIHLSPDYWAWSGLTNSPAAGGPQADYTLANGTGIDFREMDGGHVQNIRIDGYLNGIRFGRGVSGDNAGNPQFFNVAVTNCVEALKFDSTKDLDALDCTFSGTSYGIHRVLGSGGNFYGCAISGGSAAVLGDPGSPGYTMNFQNCTFSGAVNLGDNASLRMVNSAFSATGTNIILNSGVVRALVAGSSNAGPANIVNNSGAAASRILISTNATAADPLPSFPTNYVKTRQPDKPNLFPVTNSVFAGGAKGDGATDDTAAIQAAIRAAGTNGGGIVFFPAGTYRVTSSLIVSNGVELRGIFGGRHGNSSIGSMLQIDTGGGSSNGTPFITLNDRAGIRGMNLNYKTQYWQLEQQIAYPYMIRCQGDSNYAVDLCCGNLYQGVDINGASGALVEYCFFGGLRNTYRIRGGSTDCRIQNSHIKPVNDWWLANEPPTTAEPGIVVSRTADVFVAEDCTNLTIYGIFNHASHTLFTQRGGTGQAMFLGGEVLQRGYVMETAPATGTFNFLCCGANVSSQGDGTGSYGWWLQSNYTGTLKPWGVSVLDSDVDYLLRVDNVSARLLVTGMGMGQERGITGVRSAGEVTINDAGLGERFNLEVPAGGRFNASYSFLPSMPNPSQTGSVIYTNCIIDNTYIAADANESPYRPLGMTMETNNLSPVQVKVFPSPGETRDQTAALRTGWHLTGGSNFTFHVTDPEFLNSTNRNVTVELKYLEDTDGTMTVAYSSTTGMVSKAVYTLTSTNGAWRTKSFSVTNARFAATNEADVRITVSGADPVLLYLLVESSYLGVPEPPPTAGFTAVPTNGTAPLPVTFTDQSEGSITNLLWDFGDGQTTNTAGGAQVEHVYQAAGSYTVTLIASGPGGASTNTQSGCITVSSAVYHVLTASAGAGGTVSPASTNVLAGGSADFVITAGNYYRIVSLTTNGTAVAGLSFDNNSTTVNFTWSNVNTSGVLAAIFTNQVTTNAPAPVPYEWLAAYGLTNYGADVSADQDSDGLTAWQEYIAGTNPTNGASCFKAVQNTRNVITWNAVSGRIYSVYWSTNLVKGFTALSTNIVYPQSSCTNTTPDSRINHYQIKVRMQ